MQTTITTKVGQTMGLGKWDSAAAMIRLVRELQDRLDEAGLLAKDDFVAVDNVLYTFMATLPKKVSEEVRHG
jgi:hypothetical protein